MEENIAIFSAWTIAASAKGFRLIRWRKTAMDSFVEGDTLREAIDRAMEVDRG
jgi:hypothetical protein